MTLANTQPIHVYSTHWLKSTSHTGAFNKCAADGQFNHANVYVTPDSVSAIWSPLVCEKELGEEYTGEEESEGKGKHEKMVNLAVSNKKEAVVRKETFFFFSINRIINVVIITTEEPPVKPSIYAFFWLSGEVRCYVYFSHKHLA